MGDQRLIGGEQAERRGGDQHHRGDGDKTACLTERSINSLMRRPTWSDESSASAERSMGALPSDA